MALALPLLVLFGRANHEHLTVTADDLTILTTLFDGCAYFHFSPLSLGTRPLKDG